MIRRLFTFAAAFSILICLVVLWAGIWSYFGNVDWTGQFPGGIELSASGCAGKARLGVTHWSAESKEWWKKRPGTQPMIVTGKTVVIADAPATIYATSMYVNFGIHEWHGLDWRSGAMSKSPTTTSTGVMSMPLVPYWTMTMPWAYALPLPLILPLAWLILRIRTRKTPPGHCKNCGYDLRASSERCPECGTIPA